MMTLMNDSPMAGREGSGDFREIRDRLIHEARTNISIKLEEAAESTGSSQRRVGQCRCRGRRRDEAEGFEVLLSRPTVTKET